MTASARTVEAAIPALGGQFRAPSPSFRDRWHERADRSEFFQTLNHRCSFRLSGGALSPTTSVAHDALGAHPQSSQPRADISARSRRENTLRAKPIGEPKVDVSNEPSTGWPASIGGQ
jgi:hypothetical protein